MHVVGVPIGRGFKRGLSTKVSKRSVFTPQVLSEVLQDKMRADANHYMKAIFLQEVKEKKKGKNHDLTVAEYKVAKEEEKIEKLSTDKIELEADLLVLNHKKSTKQKKLEDLDGEIESSNIFLKAIRQIKQFIQAYLPFAPLTPEFANHVERGADIEAGIPKRTDTAGDQAGKPHWHDRAVSAECGSCGKAGTAYGCKNEPEPYALNLTDIPNRQNLKSCNAQLYLTQKIKTNTCV